MYMFINYNGANRKLTYTISLYLFKFSSETFLVALKI
jgi:hypothetical protein